MYSGAVGMKSSMGIRFSELGNLDVSISIPLLDFSDEFYSDLTGIKKKKGDSSGRNMLRHCHFKCPNALLMQPAEKW